MIACTLCLNSLTINQRSMLTCHLVVPTRRSSCCDRRPSSNRPIYNVPKFDCSNQSTASFLRHPVYRLPQKKSRVLRE